MTIASPAFLLSQKASQLPADAAPARLASLAADLDDAGELAAAAEMYRAALAAGGPQPELCFQLGDVLYRAGELPAARERYFMALELDEDYIEARVNLGCVLRELGDLELAASAFAGAIHAHEPYADAHFHLARILDTLGREEEAAYHWQRFQELAPDSPWADEALARLT
jgi:tetratricopeptide (TPR) repeat protein